MPQQPVILIVDDHPNAQRLQDAAADAYPEYQPVLVSNRKDADAVMTSRTVTALIGDSFAATDGAKAKGDEEARKMAGVLRRAQRNFPILFVCETLNKDKDDKLCGALTALDSPRSKGKYLHVLERHVFAVERADAPQAMGDFLTNTVAHGQRR